MRHLLAIAELRLRGATAARLPWLVPLAFAAGFAVAGWVPGTDRHARAASADGVALSGCAAVAVLVVLVIAATTFAGEIRSAVAQTILSTPLARGTLVAGGAVGHACFGFLLVVALGAAAALGLDVAGLGVQARTAVRPYTEVAIEGSYGFAELSKDFAEVRARFRVPDPVPDELRFLLTPRAQFESDFSPAGVIEVQIVHGGERSSPGRQRGPWRRVEYRAGTAFDARVGVEGLRAGEDAAIVLRRVEGGWKLRFGPGSIEVGGARELFGWNLVKASFCLLPLLLMAAAAGAAASARLGAAASLALVLFLLFLVAGRDVILDAAVFIVEEGAAQSSGRHDELPGHEGHDHSAHVSPLQVALARGALVGMRAVPDAADFWRFGDLAAGRAVTPADGGRAAASGALPCAALLAASWLLVRRRELQAG